MSYARWSNSDWYVFWYASDSCKRAEQRLALWYVSDEEKPNFEYALLKNVKTVDDLAKLMPEVDPSALPEALEYISEWLADVAAGSKLT